ncbi:sodium:calcium antiporter [Pelagerythrobacter aerophilus]|uniref:Sodium:calcium antiporter n=1 Tax=Pelagerythrobacter aerophilus TaxID=2306995 RepID=A0A418NDS1_9SPHN|nr:sodium:calcium antiporter [Pelagerythrobacter aerophilus]RIV75476.1 sodium:calcium antiporter [Pelagerythrobacter aerophilus]
MPLTDAVSNPPWANAAIFVTAGIVVWFAGVRLTRNLETLAARLRIDRVFVGMLLLGGITSLPEVANVATASVMGNPALAANNLLGSAAINVVLLAVADAWLGRPAVTGIVARPSTMMMATLCMLVLIAVALAITIGDLEVFGVGVGALAICALSIGCFRLATGYDARSPWRIETDEIERGTKDAEDTPVATPALWLRVAIDGSLIFAAGYALSQTGDAIAEQTGIASALVGFALIGLATSTPELATILTALRLHRPEMAFGQVLGTNFVNLSLILLGDALFAGGPIINELGAFEVVSALLGAALIGIFLVGLLEHRDRTVLKMGYDSAAVILLFALGLGLLSTL